VSESQARFSVLAVCGRRALSLFLGAFFSGYLFWKESHPNFGQNDRISNGGGND